MSNALPEIGSFVRIVTSRGPVNFVVAENGPYNDSVRLSAWQVEDTEKLCALYNYSYVWISADSPNWVSIELDDYIYDYI